MVDIQSQNDSREIPLMKVGVRGLEYPIQVLDKTHKTQHTSARADLFVNLPHHFKGTHMSRFIEIFHRYRSDLSMKGFLAMLSDIRQRLCAEQAFGSLAFPFFMEKCAPVSGRPGMMSYDCTYEATVGEGSEEFWVSVAVPVTTLCPCSRAISRYGAHNQRGTVVVKVQSSGFFWLEDLIALVEASASCELYSLLKREDEKYVTEHAYDNPRFVEDVVREAYIALKNSRLFRRFSVEAENYESIHKHNAYAYTEYT